MKRKRITRTIVIEGEADWADAVHRRCHLPLDGSIYETPFGAVSCTSLAIEDLPEKQEAPTAFGYPLTWGDEG
jgi:hypothetical protein